MWSYFKDDEVLAWGREVIYLNGTLSKGGVRTLVNCFYPALSVTQHSFRGAGDVRKMVIHITAVPSRGYSLLSVGTTWKKRQQGSLVSAQGFSILPTDCSHAFGERVTLK